MGAGAEGADSEVCLAASLFSVPLRLGSELCSAAAPPDALKDRDSPPIRALPALWAGKEGGGRGVGSWSAWKEEPMGKAGALDADAKGGTWSTRVRVRLSTADSVAPAVLVEASSSCL